MTKIESNESAPSPTNWKAIAIAVHVVALILAGTLIQLFSAAPAPSARGMAIWMSSGAGLAIAALAIGLLGLLAKQNRPLGFIVMPTIGMLFIVGGTF